MIIYRQDVLKRTAIAGLFGLVVLVFLYFRANYVYSNYSFNGRVDSVFFSDKRAPVVLIDKKKYVLEAADWNIQDSCLIHKGDSMIKNKGSLVIKLVRLNGYIIIKGRDLHR
ncbi:hypothetical protein ACFGVR_13200 [Mucilaginibacter sp. AW1-3]